MASAGGAKLLQGPDPLSFNQPFDSDTGFTYDSLLAEFSGGQVQQLAQSSLSKWNCRNFTDIKDQSWR